MPDTDATHTNSPERILEAAAQLFAEHGFHGVTTRQIAAAANLNIGTVHHHLGTKGAIYRAVYERLRRDDEAFVARIESLIEGASPESTQELAELLTRFVDMFVDFVAADPLRARLYMRHWLETDPALRGFEAQRSLALYKKLRRILRWARDRGLMEWAVDPGVVLRNIDWVVYSHFVCGAFNWRTWRADPRTTHNLRTLKTSLHVFLCAALRLPETAQPSARNA